MTKSCRTCEHWTPLYGEMGSCDAPIPQWLVRYAETTWPERGKPVVSADDGAGCETWKRRSVRQPAAEVES
jgi:hypothetical protein